MRQVGVGLSAELRGVNATKVCAEGPALVVSSPISPLGDLDPESGELRQASVSVAGKVLVVPGSRGSTVGAYVLYAMAKRGVAPAAVVSREPSAVLASGCAMAGIPFVCRLDRDPLAEIATGDFVEISADGLVRVRRRAPRAR